MRFFFILSLLVATLAAFRPALAQPPPRAVIVVEVDAAATEIDAATLRKSIGDELAMDAVAPDDPRAASARGTIHVAIDRATKKLVVSYRARSAPIVRDVALPDDAAGAVRAAVVLAGNLARDEASDLADELRKRAQKPAPPKAAPTSNDEARLRAVLAYNAEEARGGRRALGWSLFAAGVVSAGAGVWATTHESREWGSWLQTHGALFVGLGVYALTSTSDREALWLSRDDGVEAIEARWAKLAEEEHRMRRVLSTWLVIASGVGLAVGAVETYLSTTSSASDWEKTIGPLTVLTAGAGLAIGAYGLATDGPTESALRTYERSIGRKAWSMEAMAGGLRLSMVPGGAVVGVGGAF